MNYTSFLLIQGFTVVVLLKYQPINYKKVPTLPSLPSMNSPKIKNLY
jgi:hypothetical protein